MSPVPVCLTINALEERGKQMGWNVLSAFAVVSGLLLMFTALDTLIEWRAWFLAISGLVLFLPGAIRLYLRMKRRGNGE